MEQEVDSNLQSRNLPSKLWEGLTQAIYNPSGDLKENRQVLGYCYRSLRQDEKMELLRKRVYR